MVHSTMSGFAISGKVYYMSVTKRLLCAVLLIAVIAFTSFARLEMAAQDEVTEADSLEVSNTSTFGGAVSMSSTLRVVGVPTFDRDDWLLQRHVPDSTIGVAELKTATGSSTGTGTRSIAHVPHSFSPSLTGDPLCGLVTTPRGWDVSMLADTLLGETLLPSRLNSPYGMVVVGSDLLIVDDAGPESVWRLPLSDLTTGTETLLPSALNNPRGMAVVGSDLLIVDDTGNPERVWRLPLSNPTTGTETLLPSAFGAPSGMVVVGSDLLIVDNTGQESVWRFPLSNLTTGTETLLPSALRNPHGIVVVGSDLLIVDNSNPDSVWRLPLSDLTTSTETMLLPSALTNPRGIAVVGSDLLIVDDSGPESVWRLPLSDLGATACGDAPATVSWTYVTASDEPALYTRVTQAGVVVEMWQSEDRPASAPISIPWWVTTTDAVVDVGPPPVAILSALYAASPVRADALAGLGAYLLGRGWLASLTDVSQIAGVPTTGCGTLDGDCEPAARLHALRYLAAAGDETVFSLVTRETRIDTTGIWTVE